MPMQGFITPGEVKLIRDEEELLFNLSDKITEKRSDIAQLIEDLYDNYSPDTDHSEVGEFEGYVSLNFFYKLGKIVDATLSKSLNDLKLVPFITSKMKQIRLAADAVQEPGEKEAILSMELDSVNKSMHGAFDILKNSMVLEELATTVYKRSIDQYRYLQRRFLNIGVDDTRVYRSPLNETENGYDLSRVPYVKTELVDNNALLTDLLLDIASNLPREHKKRKGKKEVKYVDKFNMERSARILVELSDPQYKLYLENPALYFENLCGSIKEYHKLFSDLEPHLREIIDYGTRIGQLELIANRRFSKGIYNPNPVLNRTEGIDYNSIMPDEDDVKPSNGTERRFFAARKKLLQHLNDSIKGISEEKDYDKKLELAKEAVEKAVKLKSKAEESLHTKKSHELDIDKKKDNEFYVGVSGKLGEFGFAREPAPKTKYRDVYGKSFDGVKSHVGYLADYQDCMHLYSALAPRGKIKSNIILIGPYGCGKTEMIRAIAGDPKFIGAEVNVTDLLTAWFGEFQKNVDRVWDAADELRKNSGDNKLVLLLMDEFDAWFNGSRGHWVDSTFQQVQKALQIKLDGVVDYPGVITVGLTNEPAKIPLAIYRRFKYVDIVGELLPEERVQLLKHFLQNSMPLSHGFRKVDYNRWSEQLEGATGDVIGKVVDNLYESFMKKFKSEHPKEGKKLNSYAKRALEKDEPAKQYLKGEISRYLTVSPDWLDSNVSSTLSDPIIRDQIETAKRVYKEARDVMENLQHRKDSASGYFSDEEKPILYGPAGQPLLKIR